MAFSEAQVAHIAIATLDAYMNEGDDAFQNSIQDKPLIRIMERHAKTFPGGKGAIKRAVQGVYGAAGTNDSLKGYNTDDELVFYTPANLKEASYSWKEHHLGTTITYTQLKNAGITITDGGSPSRHTEAEMVTLVDMLRNHYTDQDEQIARGLNTILWENGSQDNSGKTMAGMRAFITTTPTTGTTGGLSRVSNANPWWRNRTATVTSNPVNGGALLQLLQREMRQLVRYGARPRYALAGSDFIGALERELRANGSTSMTGFSQGADIAVGQIRLGRVLFEYDPYLDDNGRSKLCYIWDPDDICLAKMAQEWRKPHKPERPHNKFVLYNSITYTGAVVARRLNGSAVYAIS